MTYEEYKKERTAIYKAYQKLDYTELLREYGKTREAVKRQKNRLKKAVGVTDYTSNLGRLVGESPTITNINKKVSNKDISKQKARAIMLSQITKMKMTQKSRSYTKKGSIAIQKQEVDAMGADMSDWYGRLSTTEKTNFWDLYHKFQALGIYMLSRDNSDIDNRYENVEDFRAFLKESGFDSYLVTERSALVDVKERRLENREMMSKLASKMQDKLEKWRQAVEEEAMQKYKEEMMQKMSLSTKEIDIPADERFW